MKTLTKLTIDADKWLRGDNVMSVMLDRQGKMCCLGFLGKACGYTDDELLHRVGPGDACRGSKRYQFPETVAHQLGSTHWTQFAIKINDDGDLTEEERREKLIKHFKLIGIELTFVG